MRAPTPALRQIKSNRNGKSINEAMTNVTFIIMVTSTTAMLQLNVTGFVERSCLCHSTGCTTGP